MQNVKLKKMFYLSIYKNIPSIRSLGPKNLFWANLGPKDVPSHKSRAIFQTFINKASSYSESRVKSNELLKYYTELLPRGLRPKN